MRRLRGFVLAVLLFGAAGPARAQQAPSAPFTGRPVTSVRLVVEGRPTEEPALVDLVQVRAGQPFSMVDVRESIAHLFGLGRFQDVRVDASPSPGGVDVTFDLVPVHGVEEVEFRGNLGLSKGFLQRTIASRFGATPPVGRAPEAARMLQEQVYPDNGYLRATVTAQAVERHDPDRTSLTFEIDSGPRARIGAVRVVGDVPGDPDRFLREVGAVTGRPYQPLKLDEELQQFVEDLRKADRYDASARFRPTVSDDGTRVDLTVTVEPGPVVALRFEGDPLPEDRLDDLVPIEREASAHEDVIEDSELRIRSYLAQQGYWKASVGSAIEDAAGRRTIVFTVRRGLLYRVGETVEVRGNRTFPLPELQPLLAQLQAGEIYVGSNLEAAAAAIEASYRRRGHAQVKVTPAANELNPVGGVGQVKPVITIEEGPLTRVAAVTFEGESHITEERLRALVRVAPGEPYYPPQLVADRDAVLLEYLNEGFAAVEVRVEPALGDDGTAATIAFAIKEGPQTIVDHILIVGNTKTDPAVIRRELQFEEGQPLGLADLVESRRRLGALGLFRRVQITELSHGTAAHDVLVTVDEAPRTTIGYGGGIEGLTRLRAGAAGEAEERFEFAPRGFFDITRRNVGGKNRSVSLYTRVSLRRSDAADETDGSGLGFSEYRLVATYREPRPFGAAGDLGITGALEQGIRSTFNFVRKGVTAEMTRRLGVGLRGIARYTLSTTKLYDVRLTDLEQELIDRRFPQVRLSSISAALIRDTRDDLVEPTRGTFLSVEGSLAPVALGSQVGFVKSYSQGLWFRPLFGTSGAVLATRAAAGIAAGFAREEVLNGTPVTVDDLPASERFFAGGSTTLRGFALDSVGTPQTFGPRGFPVGGNAMLLLNGELRVPIWGRLGGQAFVDGGNVYRRVEEFSLADLRGSVGFGLRFRSPIGPVRLDMGFPLDRQIVGGDLEPAYQFHFLFGHAF
jgi:outer membrane protein assembly complex protein YaeT